MATSLDFGRFRCLTFDCFGTLIDWERGLGEFFARWCGGRFNTDELLATFAEVEPAVQRESPALPYRGVLAECQRRLARRFGLAAEISPGLADSLADWPAFADTPGALARLKRRYRLVIVSNVDRVSLDLTLPKLGVAFDATVTAEQVGAYKPDERMFRRALEVAAGWGVGPREVLHVAQSLYHDHVPAKRIGLATAWVDRRRGRPGGATPAPGEAVTPDITVATLAELADRVEAAP